MADPGARRAVAAAQALRRHALVWLAPEHHASVVGTVNDATLRAVAARFLAAGWPLIVRSQAGARPALSAHGSLAVGMPLPPSRGKERVAFAVPPDSILRIAPPPSLAEAIPRLPPTWRSPLQRLVDGGAASGIELRVFGSAAWEALTGWRYLTPQSDIDLLWRPASSEQLAAGIALLGAWEARTGLVADGEILFGDDAAVAWREWRTGCEDRAAREVLVKTLHGPRLCAPRELIARLAPKRAAAARAAA